MIPFSSQPCMTSWTQWSADWPVRARRGLVVIQRVTVVIARSISDLVVVRLYVVVVTTALMTLFPVSTSLLLVEQALEGETICKRGQ